jgi:hypothetical protein
VYLVNLREKTVQTRGLLFDFIATGKAFQKLKYSNIKDACHIILTSRLFATYDEQKRLHIRAAIFGWPSVISTSGIIEGPAKPKEYYLYKQRYSSLGVWEIEEAKVKQKFKGRFIDYNDKRMTDVLKGYIAQAIFLYITGNPFCESKNCRLYNAHWQTGLIYAQIKNGRFCPRHKKALARLIGPVVRSGKAKFYLT